jgi:membrane-associated protease RseP (regulator of RpoE activity)
MNDEQFPPILSTIPRYVPPPRTGPLTYPAPQVAQGIPASNLILFFLTLWTTSAAGALMAGANHPFLNPFELAKGFSFSIPLMAILLSHEMGHYVTARRNGVATSWPFFLPAPFPSVFIIGTFGAFIRMKSAAQTRRVMFDIGAAGPWAGAVLSVIAVIIGLHRSEVLPLDQSGGLQLGNSLLFLGLAHWMLGVDPNSVTINLDPVAFAGWIGLFVTTLNLLPSGQLDGGHVVYALFGRLHYFISRACILACIVLAIVPPIFGWSFWLGWLLWAALLYFLGLRHPSALDPETPLDPRRRLAALLTIALFVVTFSPVPFSFVPPSSSPPPQGQSYNVLQPASRAHAPLDLRI